MNGATTNMSLQYENNCCAKRHRRAKPLEMTDQGSRSLSHPCSLHQDYAVIVLFSLVPVFDRLQYCFCILQVIKNWMVESPWNEARYCYCLMERSETTFQTRQMSVSILLQHLLLLSDWQNAGIYTIS